MNKALIWAIVIVLVLAGIFLFKKSNTEVINENNELEIEKNTEITEINENSLESDEDVFDEIDSALEYIE